jgi:hypothetical protein
MAPFPRPFLTTELSSVNSLRKGMKTNPNLRRGVKVEKASVGSFANPGYDRINICHTRYIVEKKQNISLSFDPTSMICYSCVERGGHPVCIEEEGGGRQCFTLADQTFPAALPCKKGECAKIIRIEDDVNELVGAWLEITNEKKIPAGSVVTIFLSTHLLMEGLEGYVTDLIKVLKRIKRILGGGGGLQFRDPDLSGWLRQPRRDP